MNLTITTKTDEKIILQSKEEFNTFFNEIFKELLDTIDEPNYPYEDSEIDAAHELLYFTELKNFKIEKMLKQFEIEKDKLEYFWDRYKNVEVKRKKEKVLG